MLEVTWTMKVARGIFKFFRMIYGSWIFYFFPYMSLIMPYIAMMIRL